MADNTTKAAPAPHTNVMLNTGNFGSFYSGDVEALIRMPADAYAPPPRPFDPPSPPLAADLGSRPFGAAFRDQFLIDFDAWTFVNHGAFGGALAVVADDAERWRRHCERQPLRFIDRELFPHMVACVRAVAAAVNAPPTDVVLLPNATTALNVALAAAFRDLKAGDAVFSLDVGYGSVKKMIAHHCAERGGDGAVAHVTASVPLPLEGDGDGGGGADAVVRAVKAALPPNAKLAVFDAVTSNSALALPLERLVALCRERCVAALIGRRLHVGSVPILSPWIRRACPPGCRQHRLTCTAPPPCICTQRRARAD